MVGGGAAGMTAAVTAHDAGLKVILLEKSGTLGGNTPVHQFMAAFAGFAALFVVTLILVRKETA